jgi:integrase
MSRQAGSLRLQNGVWRLVYRELDHRTGERPQRNVPLGKFKTKTAARRAADVIMARIDAANNGEQPIEEPDAKQATFGQFVETRWRAYAVEKKKYEPSTLDHYTGHLRKHILPYFADRPVAAITTDDIAGMLGSLSATPGTREVVYVLLCVIFDLAVEYELIERSPVKRKLFRPEKVEKPEKPTLTVSQVRDVLDNLGEPYDLLGRILAATGLRIGEAMALRWSDFDPLKRRLGVDETLYRRRAKKAKTRASVRSVRLSPEVVDLLRAHFHQSSFQADADFVFCEPDGQPLKKGDAYRELKRAMAAAGIKRQKFAHGFHILRHTAATLMYEQTGDLKAVQAALGHANVTTTAQTYVHPNEERVAEATEWLARAILGDDSESNGYLSVTQESEAVN